MKGKMLQAAGHRKNTGNGGYTRILTRFSFCPLRLADFYSKREVSKIVF
jgi:hypothetical protein